MDLSEMMKKVLRFGADQALDQEAFLDEITAEMKDLEFAMALNALIAAGLMEESDTVLVATEKGVAVAREVGLIG